MNKQGGKYTESMKQRPMQGIPRQITDDGELRCLDCGMKPISEFRKQTKSKGRAYFDSRCNTCRRAKLAEANHRIESDRYQELMTAAQGRCALCDATGVKLVLDHCHTTGKLRGVICEPCNMGMAAMDRYPDFGKRAAMYIEYWKGVPSSEQESAEAKARMEFAARRVEVAAKRPLKKRTIRTHWPSVQNTLRPGG